MTVFMVQDKNPLKYGVLIDSFREGARQPAILVSEAHNGFSADNRALAVNFANLLNGGVAQERPETGGKAVHYSKHDHGVTLYHRDPAGGVSVPAVQLTVIDSLPGPEKAAVMGRLTATLMKDFCNAMDTSPKAELSAPLPAAPKTGPRF